MKKTRLVVAVALTAVMGLSVTGTANSIEAGNDAACTPGYWKNHVDNWLEAPGNLINPDRTMGSTFELPADLSHYGSITFTEALRLGGGPGVEGAANTLLKHATAAYLNAAFDDDAGNLQYPLRRMSSTQWYPAFDGIIAETNDALESLDRRTMLELAAFYDGIANELPCPLS